MPRLNHKCPECSGPHRDMRVKMLPRGRRKKGSGFELVIAKQIAEACGLEYGPEIRRTPNSGALTTRADLWVTPKKRYVFPYFVELKKREFSLYGLGSDKWPPYEWYMSAKGNAAYDRDYEASAPVWLIFACNNMAPWVMMETDELTRLYSQSSDAGSSRWRIHIRFGSRKLVIISWARVHYLLKTAVVREANVNA